MSATDTLCFGDADGVTGMPTIDGLIDHDFMNPAMDPTPLPESGYVNGGRLTFAGGGLARVIFQGVRRTDTDRLVLGFLCRFDMSFDTSDFIAVAFRTSPGAGDARMIAIYPNLNGVGVVAGPGSGAPHFTKGNVTPAPTQINFYADNGGGWAQTGVVGVVDVKLRSWMPARVGGSAQETAWSVEISVPRTAAGGWIALNDDFGLHFSVMRVINPGLMAVQSAFPIGADLTDEPGPSYSVPQWGHALIPGVQIPAGSNLGHGVRFVNDWLGIGRRQALSGSTTLTSTIDGPAGTDNELVALIENTGAVDANDITAEFRFANWGLPAAQYPMWHLPLSLLPNPTPRRVGLTPPPLDPPVNVLAGGSGELFATWPKLQVPNDYMDKHLCMWVQLNSATTVNFTQAATRRNMNFENFSEIEREAEVSGEGYPEPPDGAADHDFLLETFCRPIVVSEYIGRKERDPELGAMLAGTIATALEDDKEFDNNNNNLLVAGATSTGEDRWRNSIVYMWVTVGYRRSGTFMTIKGQTYEMLDPSPGLFGVSAYHEGLQDKFSYSLKGDGLVRYAPHVFGLKVPHKGTTKITVKLGASPDGREGDLSAVDTVPWPEPKGVRPDDQSDQPGCRDLLNRYGIWLVLAVLVLLLLYWLFG